MRWARVSGAGLIKSARGTGSWEAPNREEIEGPAAAEAARSVMEGEPEEKGEIVLTVGSPFPHSGDLGLADAGAEDATLVAQGYAALTALRGPRAEEDPELLAQLDAELGPALSDFAFGELNGRRPQPQSSSRGGRRCRFVWARRRLPLHPAHLGALRRPGGRPWPVAPGGPHRAWSPAAASASSRLRAWERDSEALARTTRPEALEEPGALARAERRRSRRRRTAPPPG